MNNEQLAYTLRDKTGCKYLRECKGYFNDPGSCSCLCDILMELDLLAQSDLEPTQEFLNWVGCSLEEFNVIKDEHHIEAQYYESKVNPTDSYDLF